MSGYNEMTPEQAEWQAKNLARHSEARRKFCDCLQFFLFCPRKRCRRAKACQDEKYSCFDKFWPLVPEEDKNWIRFSITIKAANPGMTTEEVTRAVDAKLAQLKREALERDEWLSKHMASLQTGSGGKDC
jgi:hypothetical protein